MASGEKAFRERPFAEFTLERSEGLRVTLLEKCPGYHPSLRSGSLGRAYHQYDKNIGALNTVR